MSPSALRGCPDWASAVERLGKPPLAYSVAEIHHVLDLRVGMVTEGQVQALRDQIDALTRMSGPGGSNGRLWARARFASNG